MAVALSNRKVFLDIAKAALEGHKMAWAELMRTQISASAKQRKARRNALMHAVVAITSCCHYLDATLYFYGRARLGRNYIDTAAYETRLRALGVTDEPVLAGAKKLRAIQRELLHGAQLEIHSLEPSKTYVPENEAEMAVALVNKVKCLLEG